MRKDKRQQIEDLELALSYASPPEVARLVKKLIKLKTDLNGGT